MKSFARNLATLFLLLTLTGLCWSENKVTNASPAPGARVASKRPKIQAYFPGGIESAQIWVDGREFTSQSVVGNNWVVLNFPYDLDYGQHTIQVAGFGTLGDRTPAKWSFYIEKPHQHDLPPVGTSQGVTGVWRSTSGNTFEVSQQGNVIRLSLFSTNGKVMTARAWWVQQGRIFDYVVPDLGPQVNRATLDSSNPNYLQVQTSQGKQNTWIRVQQ